MTEPRASYRADKPKKPYRKYRNIPTDSGGYHFDGRNEARRYQELLLLLRAGEISELVVHPVYELEPKFRRANGEAVRAIKYEGDFEYIEGGKVVVEDVKGVQTAVFLLKQKLFWARYPDHELRIVKV